MCDLQIEEEGEVDDDKVSPLLESEVWDAIKTLKKRKTEGEDGTPAEFWKNFGETMKESLSSYARKYTDQECVAYLLY